MPKRKKQATRAAKQQDQQDQEEDEQQQEVSDVKGGPQAREEGAEGRRARGQACVGGWGAGGEGVEERVSGQASAAVGATGLLYSSDHLIPICMRSGGRGTVTLLEGLWKTYERS